MEISLVSILASQEIPLTMFEYSCCLNLQSLLPRCLSPTPGGPGPLEEPGKKIGRVEGLTH